MAQNPKKQENGIIKFLSGNGFYAVMAVCLIGAGATAWTSINRTMESIEENNSAIAENARSQAEEQWDFPAQQAENPQSHVQVEEEEDEPSPSPSPSAPTEESTPSESYSPPEKQTDAKTVVSEEVSYIMPYEGDIFALFSGDKLVKDVTLNEWRTHNGIDIKAPEGSEILAVADGTITDIYIDKLWGGVVKITHGDGNTSVYCGVVADGSLATGDAVTQGSVIGVTDKVPCEISLDPHLHFSMEKDRVYLDPITALKLP